MDSTSISLFYISGYYFKNMKKKEDYLTLKWGTLKEWNFHSKNAKKLLKEYYKIGASFFAMAQKDTPRQKEIICELIDDGNFEFVYSDWDDKKISKSKAKEYVMGYGKEK